MGKRKRERHNSRIRRKIRKLEYKLRASPTSSEDEEYDRYYPRSPSTSEVLSLSSLDQSDDGDRIRSCIGSLPSSAIAAASADATNIPSQDPEPNTANASYTESSEILPPEILDALGDPIGKEELLGPAINDEIVKRWGRILVEGMTKEAKETAMKKTLIPENFSLSKAPKLNLEISAVLSESVKQRDKNLEKAQNQLGLGIAGLTHLASSLIKEDLGKVETLKRLSELSQIFLDLHHENTRHRRKLITTSLDKKFSSTIAEVKRDCFLFGADLDEKIKASKMAERSGLQIKRHNANVPSTSRQQGNWRGPPRYHQSMKTPQPGGQKQRNNNQGLPVQQGRRPPPTTSRAPPAQKMGQRTRRHQ